MTYSYDKPLVIQSGPQPLKIAKVTPATATVELADGRMIMISLVGVEGAWVNPTAPDAVDVRPMFTIEMMKTPEFPLAEGTGTVQ